MDNPESVTRPTLFHRYRWFFTVCSDRQNLLAISLVGQTLRDQRNDLPFAPRQARWLNRPRVYGRSLAFKTGTALYTATLDTAPACLLAWLPRRPSMEALPGRYPFRLHILKNLSRPPSFRQKDPTAGAVNRTWRITKMSASLRVMSATIDRLFPFNPSARNGPPIQSNHVKVASPHQYSREGFRNSRFSAATQGAFCSAPRLYCTPCILEAKTGPPPSLRVHRRPPVENAPGVPLYS